MSRLLRTLRRLRLLKTVPLMLVVDIVFLLTEAAMVIELPRMTEAAIIMHPPV